MQQYVQKLEKELKHNLELEKHSESNNLFQVYAKLDQLGLGI